MGTPYTFDEGMSCHSTRIELFYFDDNFRRIAQWVRPFRDWSLTIGSGVYKWREGGSTKWKGGSKSSFNIPL